MASEVKHPSREALKRFNALRELDDEQLEVLARSLRLKAVPAGTTVIQRGDTRPFSLLLFAGTVGLRSADGRRGVIEADSDKARDPIAQLLPRRYQVVAETPVVYAEANYALLEELRQAVQGDFVVREGGSGEAPLAGGLGMEGYLADRIRRDLEADRLELPSLPEVAVRIGEAMGDERAGAREVAKLLQNDPAITAKVIRAANSALYTGSRPVETCTDAIVRMGLETTHKLVLTFAMRELFHARSRENAERMRELWNHSTRVAAICYVLAGLTGGFEREHAMLAGLVHDIGALAVLSYAEKCAGDGGDPVQLEAAVREMRGPVGAQILERWGFADTYVTAARDAEAWHRDPAPEADYADLVLVAQLHSYMGTARMDEVPMLDELPAFHKLEVGGLTPRMSLQALEEAADQLNEAESLLRH